MPHSILVLPSIDPLSARVAEGWLAQLRLHLVDGRDDATILRTLWRYAGAEREAGVPAVRTMMQVTALARAVPDLAPRAREALSRRLLLWIADACLGHASGDVMAPERPATSKTSRDPTPAWDRRDLLEPAGAA